MERNARFELTVHSFLPTMETGSGHETHLCIPLRPVMSMVLRDIPKLIDEPTIGLDAASKLAVRGFIRRLNRQRGTTVILTTHDMQDIEALTERILLIGKGRILLDGSLQELMKRRDSRRRITVEYAGGCFEECAGLVRVDETGREGSSQPGRAVFEVDTAVLRVSDAISLLSRRAEITDLSVAGATAEEMVVSLYREFGV